MAVFHHFFCALRVIRIKRLKTVELLDTDLVVTLLFLFQQTLKQHVFGFRTHCGPHQSNSLPTPVLACCGRWRWYFLLDPPPWWLSSARPDQRPSLTSCWDTFRQKKTKVTQTGSARLFTQSDMYLFLQACRIRVALTCLYLLCVGQKQCFVQVVGQWCLAAWCQIP